VKKEEEKKNKKKNKKPIGLTLFLTTKEKSHVLIN